MSTNDDRQFGQARASLAEQALLRRADGVPGADIEYASASLDDSIQGLRLAREQLRAARNPQIDPHDSPGRDEEYRKQREDEYRSALIFLREDFQKVIDLIDDEIGVQE